MKAVSPLRAQNSVYRLTLKTSIGLVPTLSYSCPVSPISHYFGALKGNAAVEGIVSKRQISYSGKPTKMLPEC